MADAAPVVRARSSTGDPPGRGRSAGRVLTGALVLFDLVLVAAALTTPEPMLWAVLAVAVVAQVSFFAFVTRS